MPSIFDDGYQPAFLSQTLTPPQVSSQPVRQQRGGWTDPRAAERAALVARMQEPDRPMYSEEEAADRVAQNQSEYAAGLAAAMSGRKRFADVGGTILKNALSNRQTRQTERGTMDPLTGKFTYSPDFLRLQQQGQLDKLDAASAMSRDAYEKELRDQDFRREIQGNALAATRAARADAAATRDATREALQSNRNATIEDRMYDDFQRDTKNTRAVLDSFKNLQAIAQKPDAASDIAFVFSYMKMLDPTSVVREGEFATAQNAAGVDTRVRNAYNKALNGQFLDPKQYQEMLGTAGRIAGEAQNSLDGNVRAAHEKAQRRGLNGLNVTGGLDLPKVKGADGAGALSAEEAAELAALQKRFGKGAK